MDSLIIGHGAGAPYLWPTKKQIDSLFKNTALDQLLPGEDKETQDLHRDCDSQSGMIPLSALRESLHRHVNVAVANKILKELGYE